MADDQFYLVSPGYIAGLATSFTHWSKRFGDAYNKALQMKLTPGSVPEAMSFKVLFDTGTKGAAGSDPGIQPDISKLRKTFDDFGTLLVATSQKYTGTEDDNTNDAEHVRDLVNGVAQDYPGAAVAILPPYGGYNQPPK